METKIIEIEHVMNGATYSFDAEVCYSHTVTQASWDYPSSSELEIHDKEIVSDVWACDVFGDEWEATKAETRELMQSIDWEEEISKHL